MFDRVDALTLQLDAGLTALFINGARLSACLPLDRMHRPPALLDDRLDVHMVKRQISMVGQPGTLN